MSLLSLSALSFSVPMILIGLLVLPLLWVLLRLTPPEPKRIALPTFRFLQNIDPKDSISIKTPLWILMMRCVLAGLIILAFAGPMLGRSQAVPSDSERMVLIFDDGWAGANNWRQIQDKALSLVRHAEEHEMQIILMSMAGQHPMQSLEAQSDNSYRPPTNHMLGKVLSSKQAESALKALEPMPWDGQLPDIENYNIAFDATQTALAQLKNTQFHLLLSSVDYKITREKEESIIKDLDSFAKLIYQNDNILILWQSDKASKPITLSRVYDVEGLNTIDTRVDALNASTPETAENDQSAITLMARASEQNDLSQNFTVTAINVQGGILSQEQIAADMWRSAAENGEKQAIIRFDFPPQIASRLQRIHIQGAGSAASTVLFDPSHARKVVAIVSPDEGNDSKAYISAEFYLNRALSPYAEVIQTSIDDALAARPAMIIFPDEVSLFPAQRDALMQWINQGGILLRFAGPILTSTYTKPQKELLPIRLKQGVRHLDSALSWGDAGSLAEISEDSPLLGLNLPEKLLVNRIAISRDAPQAQSGGAESENSVKTWLTLEDGTPFMTQKAQKNGLILFVHSAATPDWSSLPLSGFFVEMLNRILRLSNAHMPPSQMVLNTDNAFLTLPQILAIDGFGQIRPPQAQAPSISPYDSPNMAGTAPEFAPGLYARSGVSRLFNLADGLGVVSGYDENALARIAPLRNLKEQDSKDLAPPLFMAALILLLIDLIVTLRMHLIATGGGQRVLKKFQSSVYGLTKVLQKKSMIILALTLAGMIGISKPVQAMSLEEQQLFANNFHLAYIKTGDTSLDELSQDGLEQLGAALFQRTSVEPEGVIGLDLRSDEIVLFPFIYWPVAASQEPLSRPVVEKLQNYIKHGGMILFDLQEPPIAMREGQRSTLSLLLEGLTIPPLQQIPSDHVLHKSYYLLERFPGSRDYDELWVEASAESELQLFGASAESGTANADTQNSESAEDPDGAALNTADSSTVIIGHNQWAQAWARAGASGQDEMAMRFGINLVMYALTGNYKSDQIHVKHILERLGQEDEE